MNENNDDSKKQNFFTRMSLRVANTIDSGVEIIPVHIRSKVCSTVEGLIAGIAIAIPFLYGASNFEGSFLNAE